MDWFPSESVWKSTPPTNIKAYRSKRQEYVNPSTPIPAPQRLQPQIPQPRSKPPQPSHANQNKQIAHSQPLFTTSPTLETAVSQSATSLQPSNPSVTYYENEPTLRVPSYVAANGVKISALFRTMELCHKNKNHCPSKFALIKMLLEPLFKKLNPNDGSSYYPILRILFPDIDSGRACNYGLKESVIADVWGNANDLDPSSSDQKMMTSYKDPSKAGSVAGDLPSAVQQVLSKRQQNKKSKLTVGDFNTLLDELASFNIKKQVLGLPEFGSNHNSEGVRTAGNPNAFDQRNPTMSNDVGRLSSGIETSYSHSRNPIRRKRSTEQKTRKAADN